MENIRVLMVLPKRTISSYTEQDVCWRIVREGDALILKAEGRIESEYMKATLQAGSDFGTERTALIVEGNAELFEEAALQELLKAAALEFEKEPGKYPLYLKTTSQTLGVIANAARIGFQPYLGEWKEASRKQSEIDWMIITEKLRSYSSAQEAGGCKR